MSVEQQLSSSFSAMENILTALLHPDAAMDSMERVRHKRFLAAHILAGLAALTALPLYLLAKGAPSALEAIVFVALIMPLCSAFVLSRTGRIDWAHAISSCALAVLVAAVACASGGLASPVLPWLVVVPMEALASRSRRTVVTAGIVAAAAAAAVATFHALGLAGVASPWNAIVAAPAFVLSAIGYAVAMSVEACQREQAHQAALSVRRARNRALLGTIDDLLTWHDRSGGVIYASGAAASMFGASAKSLQGQGLFERVHVADRPAYLKAVTDVANGSETTSVQFRARVSDEAALASGRKRPAGLDGPPQAHKIVWLEMRARRAAMALGEEGYPSVVIGVTRDITDRIHYQEELAAAKTAAEEANASKGHFLATVSHELRTPLNAIIGFSEILAHEDLIATDPARRNEYAKIIHASGCHLNEVVNTLIDMSKIETGNFDYRPEPFDPVDLAHGCCDLMQIEADHARVSLVREIAGDQQEINADKRALKQIMLNLLSNAIKFTPVGGRVTVMVEQRAKHFILQVVDDGIGIAENDLSKLGRPFFQARSSYDRPYEGTGLGLSVVRGLIGLHGGSISVESAPGAGTAVTISMPLDCGAALPTQAAPAVITTVYRSLELAEEGGATPQESRTVRKRA